MNHHLVTVKLCMITFNKDTSYMICVRPTRSLVLLSQLNISWLSYPYAFVYSHCTHLAFQFIKNGLMSHMEFSVYIRGCCYFFMRGENILHEFR